MAQQVKSKVRRMKSFGNDDVVPSASAGSLCNHFKSLCSTRVCLAVICAQTMITWENALQLVDDGTPGLHEDGG